MFVSNNYRRLINEGALTLGERLYFNYRSPEGQAYSFEVIAQNDGLEIDGVIYNPSTAAVKYVYESAGVKLAINGWLVWQNSDGLSLTQLLLRLSGSEIEQYDPANLITVSPQQPLNETLYFSWRRSLDC